MGPPRRVAFFGSTHFSNLVLHEVLASRHEVVAIVSQPDQPAGRRMQLTPTVVSQLALERGLPLLRPQRLRGNADFLAELAQLQPDALLVASYGQILPRSALNLTPWPLNVHPSALPQLRGASPIRTALLQGLRATECCIMLMSPRLDDGDVLLRAPCPIQTDWNYQHLEDELGSLGGRLAAAALEQVAAGSADPRPQDHANATYCGTYHREDTVIDWSRPAAQLCNFIRAWDPDLGALSRLPDGKRVKLWRAELAEGSSGLEPGSILSADKRGIVVACGDGALRILELQPENKRRMSAADFLAGTKLSPGQHFGTDSQRPEN